MHGRHYLAAAAALLLVVTGCASLANEMNRAVLITYDHTNNFEQYMFLPDHYIDVNQRGIQGGNSESRTRGFWATFLICSLRNTNPEAQTFNYQAGRFYVEYDGKQHFYRPLDPSTYSLLPGGILSSPAITDTVNKYFRQETQIGPNQDTFPVEYDAAVNNRIAIYITRSSPGAIDLTEPLMLRYDGYPNVLTPRNQLPRVKTPTAQSDLATTCRPPAE